MDLKAVCCLTLLLAIAVGWAGYADPLVAGPLGHAPPAAAAALPPHSHVPSLPETLALSLLLADDPSPPTAPVKLVFVHHSTGGNWLADTGEHDVAGGLGRALRDDNYYVSATNYGWTVGDDAIGDRTDIGHWWEWFRGASRDTIMAGLYAESGQNVGDYGSWPRLVADPGGENEIVMFKSCFPNSHLGGNPADPPVTGANPLRGEDAWSAHMTVANAKGIYNDILQYFSTRQDKLFIAITAPPLLEDDAYQPTDAAHAANARAFNEWLVNDWLDGYPYHNVAVFDFYNVLTSNGGSPTSNDLGSATGNHHRWRDGAVQHTHTVDNDFAAYAQDADSHPTGAGGQKATGEFVPLLNVFYHRWKADAGTPTPTPTGTPATPTSTPTETATPTPTDTPSAGQQTMAFQQEVSPDAAYTGTTDVILANDGDVAPNANLGGTENLETFFGETEHRRSLVRWDLSALPAEITVHGATVELYRYHGDAASAMELGLYRVTRDWDEGTGYDFQPGPGVVPDGATWISATAGAAWTVPGGDVDTTTDYGHGPNGVLDQVTLPAGAGNGWLQLDATAALRAWMEEGAPNHGLLLRPESGEYTYHHFCSRDYPTANVRPRLVVTYTVGEVTPSPTPTETPVLEGRVYLPIILKGWPAGVPVPTATPTTETPSQLVQPADLVYQGAFRLPGGETPPNTFAYGGNAMSLNPDGAGGGSLFIMGHDRQAWDSLPNGNQVAEVSIPAPVRSGDLEDLNTAAFLQDFHDVTAGYFTQMEEIPKVGMQYLNHPATGPKIHLAWGQHLQPPDQASHAWFNPTLDSPNLQGVWFVGDQNLYSVNGYMLDIPAAWADAHTSGRYLATGRMRDGGQGGMGPALFAYRPWLPDGSSPPSGTHLAEETLLLYESADATNEITRCLSGYQHPDEWEGGAWITTPSGKHAVLFVGTKANGTKYWYGYIHRDGPDHVCVDPGVTDSITCRLADGSLCPPEDLVGCCDEDSGTCASLRGWWSTRFDAQLILYDPADLARVAAKELASWEPQPYASLDIDEHLVRDPPACDLQMLGWGDQRRYRIGDAAYDRVNGLLYVLELYADGAKPVVHVWRVY